MSIAAAALTNLRIRWLVLLSGYLLFLAAGFFLLRKNWTPIYAWRWLGLAALIAGVQLGTVWQALPQNHRSGSEVLLPTFGWGNGITLGRGILIAGLGGFLFSPWPTGWLAWLPGALYLFTALGDYVDGYLARITNHVTRLGESLDMKNDAWGILIVTFLVFQYGQVPIWYLLVGLARYIFLTASRLRQIRALPVYDLPFSVRRRAFAGVQMGFIAAILFPVFSPPGTIITATLFMLPFLGGFGYDWLLVSGQISPSPETRFAPGAIMLRGGALIGRALAVVSLGLLIFQVFPLNPELAVLEGLVFAMIMLGLAGRVAGSAALLLVGFHLEFEPLALVHFLLLTAGTGLLFLGSGPFSLWQPEDWFIYRRAGEKNS